MFQGISYEEMASIAARMGAIYVPGKEEMDCCGGRTGSLSRHGARNDNAYYRSTLENSGCYISV